MIHRKSREQEEYGIYRERARFSLQLSAVDGAIAAIVALGLAMLFYWKKTEAGVVLLLLAVLVFLFSGGLAGRFSRKESGDARPYVEMPRYNLDAQIASLTHFIEEQEQKLFDQKRQAFLGVALGIVGLFLVLGADLLLLKSAGIVMMAWYLQALFRWLLNLDRPLIKKFVELFSLTTTRGRLEKARTQIEWYRQNRWKQ